jgi:hypothetical protein
MGLRQFDIHRGFSSLNVTLLESAQPLFLVFSLKEEIKIFTISSEEVMTKS